jgi:hypothetical protein
MTQVKVEVYGGGGGEDWSIEVERSAHEIQTMSTARDSSTAAARGLLQEVFREVDGLLRDRMPAGPPRPRPVDDPMLLKIGSWWARLEEIDPDLAETIKDQVGR